MANDIFTTCSRRVRLGMVGGGQGAFIGSVHRIAARLDDKFTLVAGALSSDPDLAKVSAREVGIDLGRSYSDFKEMAQCEANRSDGIEAVAIVTPNHLHASVAKTFLNAGIHIICDKPMTATLTEAEELVETVSYSEKLFVLTYNYTGYPMIRQARAMVRDGSLGELRVVCVEYPQASLADKAEERGVKQAEWRTDPERAGAGGTIADIGTHAYNLAAFVTGEKPNELCAELTSFVAGRRLDDDAQILMRYANGAKGMLWASQVAIGHENSLSLRLYGTKGGLQWAQEQPNQLWYTPFGEAKQLLTRGGPGGGPGCGSIRARTGRTSRGFFGVICQYLFRSSQSDCGNV